MKVRVILIKIRGLVICIKVCFISKYWKLNESDFDYKLIAHYFWFCNEEEISWCRYVTNITHCHNLTNLFQCHNVCDKQKTYITMYITQMSQSNKHSPTLQFLTQSSQCYTHDHTSVCDELFPLSHCVDYSILYTFWVYWRRVHVCLGFQQSL